MIDQEVRIQRRRGHHGLLYVGYAYAEDALPMLMVHELVV